MTKKKSPRPASTSGDQKAPQDAFIALASELGKIIGKQLVKNEDEQNTRRQQGKDALPDTRNP